MTKEQKLNIKREVDKLWSEMEASKPNKYEIAPGLAPLYENENNIARMTEPIGQLALIDDSDVY